MKDYRFQNLRINKRELSSLGLHRLEIGLGTGYFYDRDLLITGMVRPGFHSNGDKGLSGFKLFSNMFVVYRVEHNLELIGGTVNSERLPETELFPVVGFRAHTDDKKWHIKMTLSVELRISHTLSDRVHWHSGFWLSGNDYNVSDSDGDYGIEIQDRRIGSGITAWILGAYNVSGEFGANVNSLLDLRNSSAPSNHHLDNAPILHSAWI